MLPGFYLAFKSNIQSSNLLGARELNISPHQLWGHCQQQADNGIPPGNHPFTPIFAIS